jgi:RNA polymerase sigma factor (sigma-70 family)
VDAGEVYRRLGPAVAAYLRSQRLPDPDDTLGEVFFQVARSLDGFEGDDDALRRWVFTIARNRVIDERRRRQRRLRPAPMLPVAEATEPDEEATDEELIDALRSLTEEQREVVVLRFVADLPLEEVAEMTGRTVGAVKAMQHRALAQLARRLDDAREDDDR